jgi:hypothetical protein
MHPKPRYLTPSIPFLLYLPYHLTAHLHRLGFGTLLLQNRWRSDTVSESRYVLGKTEHVALQNSAYLPTQYDGIDNVLSTANAAATQNSRWKATPMGLAVKCGHFMREKGEVFLQGDIAFPRSLTHVPLPLLYLSAYARTLCRPFVNIQI